MRTTLFFLALFLSIPGVSQKPEDAMVLIPAGEFNMGKNSKAVWIFLIIRLLG
jgi:hypothetical protein